MSRAPSDRHSRPDLDEVLADYMRQVDRGESVDHDALIAAHPELANELRDFFSQVGVFQPRSAAATADLAGQTTPGHLLRIRCPSCHSPAELAVDTPLTDLTCGACGSHFSLVDQRQATRMAPSISKMGRFELIERLGVGGFGSVWKARDKELDRTVAVKVPRQADMTSEEQEKFFREARAAAQLRHPSIVSVHEVGRDGDSIFIVSDFVRGVTLGDWLTGQQLTGREAAELCAKIADALHHAHDQGVVHRDLKPANIMIDGDGDPHLMDFGLARREVGEVTLTIDGQVLGTPAYMSPEQAQGEAHTADRRSDVYSLGVILFQLLTGEPPFRGNARMLVHQVIHDEPPSPRKLNSNISRDLETITLKCLEKDPGRRYQSARELADELRRFERGEPIHARPIGRIERGWRWCGRNPRVALLAASLLVLLSLVAVGSSLAALFVNQARERADVAAEDSNRKLARLYANEGKRQMDRGDLVGSLPWFVDSMRLESEDESRIAIHRLRIGYLLACCPRLMQQFPHDSGVTEAQFDASGDRVVSASRDGTARVWDVHTGQGLLVGPIQLGSIPFSAEFSPDGKYFVTASFDGAARVWDSRSGNPVSAPMQHSLGVAVARFSPNGKQVLTRGRDGAARVWDAVSGAPVTPPLRHRGWLQSIAWSPDGTKVVTAGEDKTARIWDASSGQLLLPPLEHKLSVYSARFSPDGTLLITASWDGGAQIWDVSTGAQIGAALEHEALSDARFSPDTRRILTNSLYTGIEVWDTETRRELFRYQTMGSTPWSEFNRDGSLVTLCRSDGEVAVLDSSTGKRVAPSMRHAAPVRHVEFNADSSLVLSASEDGTVRLWSPPKRFDPRLVIERAAPPTKVLFSADGFSLVTASSDGTVGVWDLRARKQRYPPLRHGGAVADMSLSHDGRLLATASSDGAARIWDFESGKLHVPPLRHDSAVTAVLFSPDDRLLASCGRDNTARIWSVETGSLAIEPLKHDGEVARAIFGDLGKQLFTLVQDRGIRVWDISTGEQISLGLNMQGMLPFFYDFDLSADNQWLMANRWSTGAIILWRLHDDDSGNFILRPGGPVWKARFDHTGRRIVTASTANSARVWDTSSGQAITPPMMHRDSVVDATFSPDGLLVATASKDGTARVWDATNGDPITAPLEHGADVTSITFSPDSRTIATGCVDGRVRLWKLEPEQRTLEELQDIATLLSCVKLSKSTTFEFVSGSVLKATWERVKSKYHNDSPSTGHNNAWISLLGESEAVVLKNPSVSSFVRPPVADLRNRIGEKQSVEMRVALIGRIPGYVFLNSLVKYSDANCFTVVLPEAQVAVLSRLGINYVDELAGRRIHVTGIVTEREGQIQISVDDVTSQLELFSPEGELVHASQGMEFLNPPMSQLRSRVGRQQAVEFRVQLSGGRQRVYLNSRTDYRDSECFTAVVESDQVSAFANLGISDPRKELIGKTVRVTGDIQERYGQIEIRITDLLKQLEIVEPDAATPSDTDGESTAKGD